MNGGRYNYIDIDFNTYAVHRFFKQQRKAVGLCEECERPVESKEDVLCPSCKEWVNRGYGIYP